jgi:hypothetical protein
MSIFYNHNLLGMIPAGNPCGRSLRRIPAEDPCGRSLAGSLREIPAEDCCGGSLRGIPVGDSRQEISAGNPCALCAPCVLSCVPSTPSALCARPAPCTLCPAPCFLLPAPCALRSAPCALRPSPCALRAAPCALRPAPCDLLSALCTLCSALCGSNPKTQSNPAASKPQNAPIEPEASEIEFKRAANSILESSGACGSHPRASPNPAANESQDAPIQPETSEIESKRTAKYFLEVPGACGSNPKAYQPTRKRATERPNRAGDFRNRIQAGCEFDFGGFRSLRLEPRSPHPTQPQTSHRTLQSNQRPSKSNSSGLRIHTGLPSECSCRGAHFQHVSPACHRQHTCIQAH